MAVVIQIDAWDPVAAAIVTLRAANHDDERVCLLNGATWWPAISKSPSLAYDLFDGAFAGQISSPSTSLALQTEPWPNFGRYQLADARVRIWSGAVGAAWAGYTLRFDGRASGQPKLANGVASIDIAVDDRWLDAPLLNTYAGTGGAEGAQDLTGQPKPLALGAPRYVAGTLIDATNSVFQVSAYGAIQGFEAALEKLARYGPAAADYPSYAALVAAAVPAGRWATCIAAGLARFGAPPAGQISFLVRGDAAGADGWARKPGQLVRRIAALSGGAGRTNDASLNALDVARPYNLSIVVDQQTTARDLVQSLAASVDAVAGVSWTGQLFLMPVGIAAAAATLRADGSTLPPVETVSQATMGPPWWRLAIQAVRCWTVHALGDIAFTATLTPMGDYAAATTYREGNIVQYQGASWVYANPTPAAGNAPPSPPSTSNDYWQVLAQAGEDGADGAPGVNGTNGQTFYTWIAYADAADGSVNFTTGAPGDRAFIGIATNKPSAVESTTPGDYSWAPYKGPSSFGLVSASGITIAGNKVIKTGGTNGQFDASVYSSEAWQAGCTLSFKAGQTNAAFMVGLNTDPTTDNGYTSIDYAFHARADGVAEIRESGASAGTFGNYTTSTVFSIQYDGKAIRYYLDGALKRTIAAAAGQRYYLDSSFQNTNATAYLNAFGAAGSAGNDGSNGANGASALAVSASPAALIVACDSSGAPKSGQFNKTSQIQLLLGATDETGAATYAIATTSCTATVSSAGLVTFSAIAADHGYADVTATYSGASIVQRITIDKVRDGVTQAAASYPPATIGLGTTVYPNPLVLDGGASKSMDATLNCNAGTANGSAVLKIQTSPSGAATWTDLATSSGSASYTPSEPLSLEAYGTLTNSSGPRTAYDIRTVVTTSGGSPGAVQKSSSFLTF